LGPGALYPWQLGGVGDSPKASAMRQAAAGGRKPMAWGDGPNPFGGLHIPGGLDSPALLPLSLTLWLSLPPRAGALRSRSLLPGPGLPDDWASSRLNGPPLLSRGGPARPHHSPTTPRLRPRTNPSDYQTAQTDRKQTPFENHQKRDIEKFTSHPRTSTFFCCS
jgi:hypothetical protein